MSGSLMTHVQQEGVYSCSSNYSYYRDTLKDSYSTISTHSVTTVAEADSMISPVAGHTVQSDCNLTSTSEKVGESASSILQSVKEQEAQFERLTRELEAERRSVADQLEQCKINSRTGSVHSLVPSDSGPGYIEQGADFSSLDKDHNDSHLVDSCLKVLQERGIMQSDDLRGKYGTWTDENNRQGKYGSREMPSVHSSRQNSYRHPEGGGMTRSQANYSLNTAAADNYGSYSELNQSPLWSQQQQSQDWQQYQNTYTGYNKQGDGLAGTPLSEGDYIESSAAVGYLNSHGDYIEDSGGPTAPPHYSFDQPSQNSYSYSQSDSQANGTHFDGGYNKQGYYKPNVSQQPSNHVQGYADYDSLAAANQEAELSRRELVASREQLAQSREHLAHSLDNLSQNEKLLSSSQEHLVTSDPSNMYHSNPAYEDEQPFPNTNNRQEDTSRFNSYSNGEHTYENSGLEDKEPYGTYGERPPSRGDRHPSFADQSSRNDRPPSRNVWPSIKDSPAYQSSGSHPMLTDLNGLYGSRHSVASRANADLDQHWRPPDLPEVIEFLSHPNDAIKANAAAYLQHLSYGNNEIKTKTRTLRGIHALVNLLHNDIPEVHRNALGALLNLSRGYENDDNKRAMKNCGGLESLAQLLERSRDNDVRELITGILWNISSLGELKKAVISCVLKTLVNCVIVPATGGSGRSPYKVDAGDISWSTEFRNATGVLRNVSSDGPYARKQLRECPGLIEALLKVANAVNGASEMDNKPVENIICTLRNLSFRLMEVDYPDHYDKKSTEQRPSDKKPSAQDTLTLLGCFGKSKEPVEANTVYPCRTPLGRGKGEQLWQRELVHTYVPIISDCSNTDTLEAAVGAIQNLTACEWQPSKDFSEQMRKGRGLPKIVELLGLEEADNVVCGAAIALRNLALDKSNRVLIGKYATEHLVSKLPLPGSRYAGDRARASEETIRAVLAALYGVLKERDAESLQHASTLVNDCEGVERLISMSKSQRKFSARTLRGVHQLLTLLWKFAALREVYKTKGYKESDFISLSMIPKSGGNTGTMSLASTLTRPRSDPPSNSNTISRSNAAFRDDKADERITGEPLLDAYPSSGTLPIQRPYYSQNDLHGDQFPTNSYNYQRQMSQASNSEHLQDVYDAEPTGNVPYSYQQPPTNSYRQHSTYSRQHSYNLNMEHTGYPHQPFQHSQQYSLSKDSPIANGNRNLNSSQNGGLQQSEPLYARVEKKKNDNASQSFLNPSYSHNGGAISMESLHNRADYSLQPSSQQNTSAGVDSWV